MSNQNQNYQDNVNMNLMLNDLENEVDKIYKESTRPGSKLIKIDYNYNRNNIISQLLKNVTDKNDLIKMNRPKTSFSDSTSQKLNTSSFEFYDILCKNCLENHLDKCDICRYKNNFVESKSPFIKSYKSILIKPNPSKNSRKKDNSVKLDSSNDKETNYYVKSISNMSNFPSLTNNRDDINKSIYAVVFKEKTNSQLNENQIEDLINSDYIDVSNLSTPFEKELINSEIVDKTTLPTDFLKKRKKTLMLLDMNQRAKLSKIKVSKHYFKNLADLHHKYRYENEKITLKSIPPLKKSSNHLFNEIDRFDINESYKIKKPLMDDIAELIENNRNILEAIRINDKVCKNKARFNGFLSNKKFEDNLIKKDKNKVRLDSPMNLLKKFNNINNINSHFIKTN